MQARPAPVPPTMTLQQILDALAVAEHGSLHAAARASGQTQPALTKSLRRLEDDLGAPLFERHTRGVRATTIGRRFLVHAAQIAAETERARQTVAQLRGEQLGRVVYGISAAPAIALAPAAIGRFRRQYPAVVLQSRGGLYHTLAPRLREGELDFMICPIPPAPADPKLQAQPLIRSDMVLVARRGHPQVGATRLAELVDVEVVILAPSGQPGSGIVKAFADAGLPAPSVMLETDSLVDTLAMVAGSDCLASLPATLAHSGLIRERLVALPVADPLPVYEVALFQRLAVPPTPAADALMRQFAREAAYLRSSAGGGAGVR